MIQSEYFSLSLQQTVQPPIDVYGNRLTKDVNCHRIIWLETIIEYND